MRKTNGRSTFRPGTADQTPLVFGDIETGLVGTVATEPQEVVELSPTQPVATVAESIVAEETTVTTEAAGEEVAPTAAVGKKDAKAKQKTKPPAKAKTEITGDAVDIKSADKQAAATESPAADIFGSGSN